MTSKLVAEMDAAAGRIIDARDQRPFCPSLVCRGKGLLMNFQCQTCLKGTTEVRTTSMFFGFSFYYAKNDAKSDISDCVDIFNYLW